jgi:hypothetical protein
LQLVGICMGYNFNRLSRIKERLAKSKARDLEILFEFLEDQLLVDYSHVKIKYFLSRESLLRIKGNRSDLLLEDLLCMFDFVDERLAILRYADRTSRDIIGDDEYWARERSYTKLENFIFKLNKF